MSLTYLATCSTRVRVDSDSEILRFEERSRVLSAHKEDQGGGWWAARRRDDGWGGRGRERAGAPLRLFAGARSHSRSGVYIRSFVFIFIFELAV